MRIVLVCCAQFFGLQNTVLAESLRTQISAPTKVFPSDRSWSVQRTAKIVADVLSLYPVQDPLENLDALTVAKLNEFVQRETMIIVSDPRQFVRIVHRLRELFQLCYGSIDVWVSSLPSRGEAILINSFDKTVRKL